MEKRVLAVSFLTAAAVSVQTGYGWAQATNPPKSERQTETGTPLPPGPRGSGSGPSPQGSEGSVGAGQSQSQSGRSGKDTSIGGTQSQRTTESDTPMPPGMQGSEPRQGRQATGTGMGRSQVKGMAGKEDVRQLQQALKDKGHDPGPIDGVMGRQTRQALRQFQSSSGLKATGALDSETAEKLNIESSSVGSMGSGSRESSSQRSTGAGSQSGRGDTSGRQSEPSPSAK